MKLAVTYRAPASIRGSARNARTHSPEQVAEIAASIERFGFANPILVDAAGEIIAGHGRLAAAERLKLAEVPVISLDGLSPAEVRALRLADNRIASNAGWDLDLLRVELLGLQADDFDVEILGFDDDELANLLGDGWAPSAAASAPAAVVEDTPPAVDEQGPVHSKQGVVYELGPHRLMCGDCRDPAQWPTLLQGRPANLVFTSPPYASQRKYDESSGFKPIPPDEYGDWWAPLQAAVRAHLAGDGSFFVNIKEHCDDGQRHLYVKKLTIRMVEAWGWRFVDELCWQRVAVPISVSGRFKTGWEPVFHFTTAACKFRPLGVSHESDSVPHTPPQGSRGFHLDGPGGNVRVSDHTAPGMARPSNVIRENGGNAGHSAAFPVGLPSFFVRAYTDPGDLVVDPFMGSGTTLQAAAQHGRHAAGFELSPRYVDVIRRRWTAYARANNLAPGPGALA